MVTFAEYQQRQGSSSPVSQIGAGVGNLLMALVEMQRIKREEERDKLAFRQAEAQTKLTEQALARNERDDARARVADVKMLETSNIATRIENITRYAQQVARITDTSRGFEMLAGQQGMDALDSVNRFVTELNNEEGTRASRAEAAQDIVSELNSEFAALRIAVGTALVGDMSEEERREYTNRIVSGTIQSNFNLRPDHPMYEAIRDNVMIRASEGQNNLSTNPILVLFDNDGVLDGTIDGATASRFALEAIQNGVTTDAIRPLTPKDQLDLVENFLKTLSPERADQLRQTVPILQQANPKEFREVIDGLAREQKKSELSGEDLDVTVFDVEGPARDLGKMMAFVEQAQINGQAEYLGEDFVDYIANNIDSGGGSMFYVGRGEQFEEDFDTTFVLQRRDDYNFNRNLQRGGGVAQPTESLPKFRDQGASRTGAKESPPGGAGTGAADEGNYNDYGPDTPPPGADPKYLESVKQAASSLGVETVPYNLADSMVGPGPIEQNAGSQEVTGAAPWPGAEAMQGAREGANAAGPPMGLEEFLKVPPPGPPPKGPPVRGLEQFIYPPPQGATISNGTLAEDMIGMSQPGIAAPYNPQPGAAQAQQGWGGDVGEQQMLQNYGPQPPAPPEPTEIWSVPMNSKRVETISVPADAPQRFQERYGQRQQAQRELQATPGLGEYIASLEEKVAAYERGDRPEFWSVPTDARGPDILSTPMDARRDLKEFWSVRPENLRRPSGETEIWSVPKDRLERGRETVSMFHNRGDTVWPTPMDAKDKLKEFWSVTPDQLRRPSGETETWSVPKSARSTIDSKAMEQLRSLMQNDPERVIRLLMEMSRESSAPTPRG